MLSFWIKEGPHNIFEFKICSLMTDLTEPFRGIFLLFLRISHQMLLFFLCIFFCLHLHQDHREPSFFNLFSNDQLS